MPLLAVSATNFADSTVGNSGTLSSDTKEVRHGILFSCHYLQVTASARNVEKLLVSSVIQKLDFIVRNESLNQDLICDGPRQKQTGHLSEVWTTGINGNGWFQEIETPDVHNVLEDSFVFMITNRTSSRGAELSGSQ